VFIANPFIHSFSIGNTVDQNALSCFESNQQIKHHTFWVFQIEQGKENPTLLTAPWTCKSKHAIYSRVSVVFAIPFLPLPCHDPSRKKDEIEKQRPRYAYQSNPHRTILSTLSFVFPIPSAAAVEVHFQACSCNGENINLSYRID
jgi:hypothetical protein